MKEYIFDLRSFLGRRFSYFLGTALLILFLSSAIQVNAESCRQKIILMAAATSLGFGSHASADLVSWGRDLNSSNRAYDLWNSRWPYDVLGEASANRLDSDLLNEKIILVMDEFEDFYFRTSESERRELSQLLTPDFDERRKSHFAFGVEPVGIFETQSSRFFGRLDDHIYTEFSPRVVRLKGGRESIWLSFSDPKDAPPIGVTTIYDSTPHTPGLYQFTVIESWGWSHVVITHHAWIRETPGDFDRFDFQRSFSAGSLEVPNSASVFTLLFAGAFSAKRRR